MSSSVGKLQIGKNDTDTTTFVGKVNVPNPKQPTNAANKKYVDTIGATSMAMASATMTNKGEGTYIGFGTAIIDEERAIAAGLGIQRKNKQFNFSISYNDLIAKPAISTGMGWKF